MPRQYRPRPGDVYWRRRVIALAAGIAVLGVVVWTVNGTLGNGGASPSANVSSVSGHHSAAPAGPSTPAAGTSSPLATGSPTPSATPTATSSAQDHHRTGKDQAGADGQHASQSCPRADIVVSLFSTRYRYRAHATPRFQVDVVSTAARGCMFDVSPRNVQLIIKSGDHRVWGSADCQASSRPHNTRLVRGVPTVLQISWNRKTSAPGCHQPRNYARPGTYTATARSGKIRSQPMIFVLSASGT
jgi:hypothetical protein